MAPIRLFDVRLGYPEPVSNYRGDLSSFSNRSTSNHLGMSHSNVFVLPGGENQSQEYVCASASGTEYFGTSFATALGSGLIAALWSQPSHQNKDRSAILSHLRGTADKSLGSYDPETYGNGLMQVQ